MCSLTLFRLVSFFKKGNLFPFECHILSIQALQEISSGFTKDHSSFLFCFGFVRGCGPLSAACRSCFPVSSEPNWSWFWKRIAWLIGNASYYSLASWMSEISKVETRARCLATAWREQSHEWVHHRFFHGSGVWSVDEACCRSKVVMAIRYHVTTMKGGVSAILHWATSHAFFLCLVVQHVWKDACRGSSVPLAIPNEINTDEMPTQRWQTSSQF